MAAVCRGGVDGVCAGGEGLGGGVDREWVLRGRMCQAQPATAPAEARAQLVDSPVLPAQEVRLVPQLSEAHKQGAQQPRWCCCC